MRRARGSQKFGGMEQAKERSRDARGVRWIEESWQDLRYGARMSFKTARLHVDRCHHAGARHRRQHGAIQRSTMRLC